MGAAASVAKASGGGEATAGWGPADATGPPCGVDSETEIQLLPPASSDVGDGDAGLGRKAHDQGALVEAQLAPCAG